MTMALSDRRQKTVCCSSFGGLRDLVQQVLELFRRYSLLSVSDRGQGRHRGVQARRINRLPHTLMEGSNHLYSQHDKALCGRFCS